MRQAYGEPLLFSVGPPVIPHSIHAGLQLSSCWPSLFLAQWLCWATVWYSCWATVVHHVVHHYSLLNGSVGQQYIDLLDQELQHFVSGSYTAEWVIV